MPPVIILIGKWKMGLTLVVGWVREGQNIIKEGSQFMLSSLALLLPLAGPSSAMTLEFQVPSILI